MKTIYRTALCGIVLLGISTATLAQEVAKENTADKANYSKLIRQIRKDSSALVTVRSEAIDEARENDGLASPVTKAQILSLQDRIDRKNTHLTLLSLRHGWEIPSFEEPKTNANNTASGGGIVTSAGLRAEIFGSVDRMIRDTLAAEAMEISAKIALPVISIGSEG